jgi:hypothetical protein
MAVTLTYDSLLTQLQSYIERGTITDPIVYDMLPALINNAERRIAREVKVSGLINVVTFAFTPGIGVVAKPDRWRQTVSINVGNATTGTIKRLPIYPRSYEYVRRYWPQDNLTQTNTPPQFYADYGFSNWLFAPTPDQAYPCEINYYQQPVLLDASNQQNWFTEYQPDMLLYAALIECAPFLKADARVPVWESLYNQRVATAIAEDKGKIIDRSTTRQED